MKRTRFPLLSAPLLSSLAVAILVTGSARVFANGGLQVPDDIEPPRAPFDMPQIRRPLLPDKLFNIRDYGAREGGESKNTEAIRQAVAACAAAGGGTVLVPAGVWLTGPVHLVSHVNFKIDKGAELRFSDDFKDYLPVVATRWEGSECYNYSPLIYADGCENIAITGAGRLIGNGMKWWPWSKTQGKAASQLQQMSASNTPVDQRVFGVENGLRPSFIQPFRCKNVLIEGVTIESGPMWTVHPVYCENIIIRGLTIATDGPNTDGINLDSCKYGLVEYCQLATGDDCICLKSGKDEDGWRVNKPCESVVIRHCAMTKGHGGVVIGSEMSGGVRNIYAHDINIGSGDRAIRVKSVAGRGGYVRDVLFENFTLGKITQAVAVITMKYGSSTVKPMSGALPLFDHITIRNITCEETKCGFELIGLDDRKITRLSLDTVSIKTARTPKVVENVDGLSLIDVTINGAAEK